MREKVKTMFEKARRRASKASAFAKYAREVKEQLHEAQNTLGKWNGIMANGLITLAMVVFFISCPVEIMVSFEMYREFLANYSPAPSTPLVWLMGLFIVGYAALVSHYLSTTISPNLKQWEVFNALHNDVFENRIEAEVEELIEKSSKRQLMIGLGAAGILLTIVTLISWQRSLLMGQLNEVNDYSLLEKILPVIVVIVEILSGVYLAYVIKSWKLAFAIWKLKRTYDRLTSQCSSETEMAFAFAQAARYAGENIEMSKDIFDVFYRKTYLSDSDDSYVEEINVSSCRIILQDEKEAVPDVRVLGVLSDSELTNAVYTDQFGEAVIFWRAAAPLSAIEANGRIFHGPFKSGHTHRFNIDLSEYPNDGRLLKRV